jgi:hypothetical protein
MTLEELMRRARLWRAGEVSAEGGLSTGFDALDAMLPGGGWPHPGLIEILASRPGIGALRLLLPALAALGRRQQWLIWVAPPYLPNAPAMEAAGLELSRVLVIDVDAASAAGAAARRPTRRQQTAAEREFWAFEQALRFMDAGAALYWPGTLAPLALRRLQLACEAGGSLGVLFRSPDCAGQASPAALRLLLSPVAGSTEVTVQVLKCRGSLQTRACRLAL